MTALPGFEEDQSPRVGGVAEFDRSQSEKKQHNEDRHNDDDHDDDHHHDDHDDNDDVDLNDEDEDAKWSEIISSILFHKDLSAMLP